MRKPDGGVAVVITTGRNFSLVVGIKEKNQLSMSSWHTLKDEDGESCKRALKRILPRVLLVAFCSAAQRP